MNPEFKSDFSYSHSENENLFENKEISLHQQAHIVNGVEEGVISIDEARSIANLIKWGIL